MFKKSNQSDPAKQSRAQREYRYYANIYQNGVFDYPAGIFRSKKAAIAEARRVKKETGLTYVDTVGFTSRQWLDTPDHNALGIKLNPVRIR